jgi:hypothetical protein
MTNPEPKSVTLDQIAAEIASEHFFTAYEGIVGASVVSGRAGAGNSGSPLSLLTFCVFVLRNGFTVTGQSACADPAKFNAEKGREIARADAIRQCWALLGFRLRDEISQEAREPYSMRDIDINNLYFDSASPSESDPLGLSIMVWARLKDGREVRVTFRPPACLPGYSRHEMVRLSANEVVREANRLAALERQG